MKSVCMFFQCSVTCGTGKQRRSVTCRTPYGDASDEQCELTKKPRDIQQCETECAYVDIPFSTADLKKGLKYRADILYSFVFDALKISYSVIL